MECRESFYDYSKLFVTLDIVGFWKEFESDGAPVMTGVITFPLRFAG